MKVRAQHRCRPLWLGPGTIPVCTQRDHFWEPLNPHAPPAKCCAISAPHHHRAGGAR